MSGGAGPLLGVEYAEWSRCRMDRLCRYSCPTPSKLYHKRSRTNHQVNTITFTAQAILFSYSLIRFLDLFKPVSWHWTFFPTLLVTDFSEVYTKPFVSNVIGHFLLLVKLLLRFIPLTGVAPRLDFTALGKVARAGTDFPRIVNTIPAILDEVWRSSLTRRLSLTSPSSYLCSTEILPPSPSWLSLLTIKRTKANKETWVDHSSWLTKPSPNTLS